MAVTKHRDANWKTYLRELVDTTNRPSEIERIEFAGHLLRRDMEGDERVKIFNAIFNQDNYVIADQVASFMIAESPDTTEDLLKAIKTLVLDHYTKETDILLKWQKKTAQEELSKHNPNDEYDPSEAINV